MNFCELFLFIYAIIKNGISIYGWNRVFIEKFFCVMPSAQLRLRYNKNNIKDGLMLSLYFIWSHINTVEAERIYIYRFVDNLFKIHASQNP